MHNDHARAETEQRIPLPTLLFAAFGPPLAWVGHFLLVYFLNAVFCSSGASGGDAAIYVATALFLAAVALAGRTAVRRWRALGRPLALQPLATEPAGRAGILLIIGITGSVLFSLLILVQGLVPLFLRACTSGGT